MEILEIVVELLSPLLAGDPKPTPTEQIRESAQYLPGALLRGAVGSELVRHCDHQEHIQKQPDHSPSCDYERIFQATIQPRFGPCYPIGSNSGHSYPLPMTAYTCKYSPGFRNKDENMHGIQDILAHQWGVEQHLQIHGRLPEEYSGSCLECDAKLDAARGYYERPTGGNYRQPRLRIQRFSRVAIDRRRHVAADQLLYTLEVIAEEMNSGRMDVGNPSVRTRLAGRVWLENDTALVAKTLEGITCLGGDRTTGLGAVNVAVDGPFPLPTKVPTHRVQLLAEAVYGKREWTKVGAGNNDIVARIANFNHVLQQTYRKFKLVWPQGTLFFCIDLLSPTIYTEQGMVCSLLPIQLAGATRMRAFATAHVHGGWHTGAGMMRRTELAIDAGSVFLYQLPKMTSVDQLQSTLNQLLTLEIYGLGNECERGYGWVEICSPFHLEVNPV